MVAQMGGTVRPLDSGGTVLLWMVTPGACPNMFTASRLSPLSRHAVPKPRVAMPVSLTERGCGLKVAFTTAIRIVLLSGLKPAITSSGYVELPARTVG